MKDVARVAIVAIVVMTAAGAARAEPQPPARADAAVQADVSQRVDQLTARMEKVESRLARHTSGAVLILFGAFCALWAQNTKRRPWRWFFFGSVFNVAALPVLLMKNADAVKGIAPSRRRTMNQAAVFLGLLVIVVVMLWLGTRL